MFPLLAVPYKTFFRYIQLMKLVRKFPYLCGLAVIIFFWMVLGTLATLAVYPLFFRPGPPPQTAYFIFLHINFLFLCGGTVLAVKRILKRSVRDFITDRPRFSVSSSLHAAGFWMLAAGIFSVLLFSFRRPEVTLQFSPAAFFLFLPAALVLTPLQTFAEEMLFRAYLRRWIEHLRRAVNPWLTCILSGVAFLAAHGANPEFMQGDHLLVLALYYFLFGAFLMAVVLRRGGIEHAFGIHLGNNLFTILIVNYEGSAVPSPSLWLLNRIDPPASMALFLLTAAVYSYVFLRSKPSSYRL